MIKAILYDVDGVILDEKFFSVRYVADYGISLKTMLPFFHGPFRNCQIGEADLYTELDKVKESWNYPGETSELIEYWFSDIATGLKKQLLTSVASLRKSGTKCYIATNQEANRMEYLWETAGLNKVFDGFFVSCDIGTKKPDTEYFEHIVKELKLSPKEIAFFDNDQRAVDAANEFGIEAYLYTGSERYKKDLEKLI